MRKIIAIALVMVITLAGVSAFAAEGSTKSTSGSTKSTSGSGGSGGFFQNMADCIESWGK